MTVTISRLYDNHDDAQHAVRRLESAGVPHSDISIVANNSDSWFNTDKKVDRDHNGVDDRAKGAGKGAGIGAGVVALPALLPGSACWQSPAADPLSQLVGWPRRRLAPPQEQLPAVLSERSRRPAFRNRVLTPMPTASVAAARWCRHEWPMRTGPASMRY